MSPKEQKNFSIAIQNKAPWAMRELKNAINRLVWLADDAVISSIFAEVGSETKQQILDCVE